MKVWGSRVQVEGKLPLDLRLALYWIQRMNERFGISVSLNQHQERASRNGAMWRDLRHIAYG